MDTMKRGAELLQDKLFASSVGEIDVGNALTDLLGGSDGNLGIDCRVFYFASEYGIDVDNGTNSLPALFHK